MLTMRSLNTQPQTIEPSAPVEVPPASIAEALPQLAPQGDRLALSIWVTGISLMALLLLTNLLRSLLSL